MTEALIRVAILDDHEYIVHSLERLLDEEPDLEVVVASTDAEDSSTGSRARARTSPSSTCCYTATCSDTAWWRS